MFRFPFSIACSFSLIASAGSSRAAEILHRFAPGDQATVSAMAADRDGAIYACGSILRAATLPNAVRIGPISSGLSPTSPTLASAIPGDAFLMKLSGDGAIVASVVWGGSASDSAQRLGIDAAGHVVVAGMTYSRDFPTGPTAPGAGVPRPPGDQASLFITRFDTTGTNLLFTRFLPGSSPDAMAVEPTGHVVVAGETTAPQALGLTGVSDAETGPYWSFVARLSADGSNLTYARSFGGTSSRPMIRGVVTDAAGHAYLTGGTTGYSLPITNALQEIRPALNASAAFLTCIDAAGELVFSTYLAGDTADTGDAVALVDNGNVVVAGRTSSEQLPAGALTPRPSNVPCRQRSFVLEIDPGARAVVRSNFFGAELGSLTALTSRSGEGLLLAGVPAVTTPVPVFGLLSVTGSAVTRLDPLHPTGWAEVTALASGAAGRVYACGLDLNGFSARGSFVAVYSPEDFPTSGAPEIRMTNPDTGTRHAHDRPLSVSAVIVANTSTVRSVTFLAGRRTIGTAMREPYSITWSNAPRGVHQLSARANINGQVIQSAPVRVTLASPRNDQFARRSRLSASSFSVRGELAGATTEPGESYGESRSVWYSWTTPVDGIFELSLDEGSDADRSLQASLLSGPGLGQLGPIVPMFVSSGQPTTFRAQSGREYLIRVWSSLPDPYPGEFRLRMQPVTPPVNDDFRQPIHLSGLPLSVVADVRHATLEPGEFSGTGGGTVWYEWTSPVSGDFLAATTAGFGSVTVVRGVTVTNLQPAGANIWGATNGIAFTAEQGTTYRIGVSGTGTNPVPWQLLATRPPPNDNLPDRLTIPADATFVTGTLIGANYDGSIPFSRDYSPKVWWSWKPSAAGRYYRAVRPLEANSGASNAFSRTIPSRSDAITIYALDNWGNLQRVASQSLMSPDTLEASPNTTYVIAVGGYLSWFALEITPITGPANDQFHAATLLTGTIATIDGTLAWASLEPDEPATGSGSPFPTPIAPAPVQPPVGTPSPTPVPVVTPVLEPAALPTLRPAPSPGIGLSLGQQPRSVWYRWTAPADGEFAASVSPGASMSIYRGSSLTGLTTVSSNAQSHRFPAAVGIEYRLQVTALAYSYSSEFSLQIRPALPAANDQFAHRQPLEPFPEPFIPEIRDASLEPGEPSPWYGPARSIWYRWTAPTSGVFLLSWSGGSPPAVYTGDALSNLVAIPVHPSPDGYEFVVTAGTDYSIAVNIAQFLANAAACPPPIGLRPQQPPDNDRFAQRRVVRGPKVSTQGSNVGASSEAEEPAATSNTSGRTVWWTWRAPRDGFVAITLQPPDPNSVSSYFSGVVAVYTGDSLATLTPVDDPIGHLRVAAGQEYQLAVDSWLGTPSGSFQLDISYHSPASNDDFADHRPFTGQAEGTLLGATVEPDEPALGWGFSATRWWTWSPTASGLFDVQLETRALDVLGAGSVAVEIFVGESPSELVPVALIQPTWPSGPGRLRFGVTAGTHYAIRVSGYTQSPRFELTAVSLPPPPNDTFARRIPLAGSTVVVTGTSDAATPDLDDGSEPEVWWSWTAPLRGAAHIRVSALHPLACFSVKVYTGSTLAALQLVAEPDDEVTFPVEAGQTYHFAVQSAGCLMGSGAFELALTTHRPPANDIFARRIPVVGTEPRVTDATIRGAGVEPDEPAVPSHEGSSVWWKWTVPESGRYTMATAWGNLAVFTGSNLSTLTLVASNRSSFPALNIPLTAGTELSIRIAGDPSAAPALFTWSIRQTEPPPNDHFANRTALTGDRVLGTLEASSREATDPWFALDPLGTSIWWSLTPTNTGWRRLVLNQPSNLQAEVSLFTGTDPATLQWVPPAGDWFIGRGFYYLEAGVAYALQVTGANGWFGPVDVSFHPVATATNDWFTNAVVVAGSDVSMTADNRLCTLEPFEPRRPDTPAENSVWWRWTAPASGVFSITRSNSPAFAYVDVYTGSTLSNLVRVPETAYGRGFAEYLFRAEANVTYFIAGTTPAYSQGVIQLRLLPANPPPNDDFARRTLLAGHHVITGGTNIDATAESGDPVADQIGQQTVWWRWTAPASGRVTLQASAGNGTVRGGVFRGDSLSTLAPVAGPDLIWPKEFSAEAGAEYAIGVTTWSAWGGPITLTLDLAAAQAASMSRSSAPSASAPSPADLILSAPAPGTGWIIESSTNLLHWQPTLTNAPGVLRTPAPILPGEPARFFRARRQ